MRSLNQPVLSNKGKVSCSKKQREPLVGFDLTTDRYPPSQTLYPLRHAAPVHIYVYEHDFLLNKEWDKSL